jgi:hypothetical protein
MSEPKTHPAMHTVIARFEEIKDRNFRSSFLKMLELYKDKEVTAVEVGVYEGINAKHMLIACPKMKLYLVDDWSNLTVYTGGPVQEEGARNIIKGVAHFNLTTCGANERIGFTYKNSEESSKLFTDGFFDYVYIDGDHTHDAVKLDLELWFPKVKSGGLLGGHDFAMQEVSSAVSEFILENKIPHTNCGHDVTNNEGRSDFWICK